MFNTYTGKWLTDDLFKSGFCFNSTATNAHEFMYKVPQGTDISVFRDYINSLPYVHQPGVFAVHVNADLTFRLQESAYMLETIQVGRTLARQRRNMCSAWQGAPVVLYHTS